MDLGDRGTWVRDLEHARTWAEHHVPGAVARDGVVVVGKIIDADNTYCAGARRNAVARGVDADDGARPNMNVVRDRQAAREREKAAAKAVKRKRMILIFFVLMPILRASSSSKVMANKSW